MKSLLVNATSRSQAEVMPYGFLSLHVSVIKRIMPRVVKSDLFILAASLCFCCGEARCSLCRPCMGICCYSCEGFCPGLLDLASIAAYVVETLSGYALGAFGCFHLSLTSCLVLNLSAISLVSHLSWTCIFGKQSSNCGHMGNRDMTAGCVANWRLCN